MIETAFEYSEAIKEPAGLRIVTRLGYAGADVETSDIMEEKPLNISVEAWVLLPEMQRSGSAPR